MYIALNCICHIQKSPSLVVYQEFLGSTKGKKHAELPTLTYKASIEVALCMRVRIDWQVFHFAGGKLSS